mmetsp:Transcript_8983/g.18966  ORF Transcript_8983/g.18966 Transcript_8983/m.18966 type:complete len:241 (-) Transcript_8983:1183-1905(-)
MGMGMEGTESLGSSTGDFVFSGSLGFMGVDDLGFSAVVEVDGGMTGRLTWTLGSSNLGSSKEGVVGLSSFFLDSTGRGGGVGFLPSGMSDLGVVFPVICVVMMELSSSIFFPGKLTTSSTVSSTLSTVSSILSSISSTASLTFFSALSAIFLGVALISSTVSSILSSIFSAILPGVALISLTVSSTFLCAAPAILEGVALISSAVDFAFDLAASAIRSGAVTMAVTASLTLRERYDAMES